MKRYSRASMRRLLRQEGPDALDSPVVLPAPSPPALLDDAAAGDRPPADLSDAPADRPEDADAAGRTAGGVAAGTVPTPSHLPARPARPEAHRWEGEGQPLVPASLAHPIETARFAVRYAGRAALFHLFRLHVYAGRAIVWTPRGLARIAAGVWSAALDQQAAPLRAAAIERGDIGGYLLLAKDRDRQVRRRSPLAVLAALAVAGAAVLVLDPSTRIPAVLVLVAVGGWFGRPADRSFVDSSVVSVPGARRITAPMLVEAFTDAGLCTKERPITFAGEVARDRKGYGTTVILPGNKTALDALKARVRLAAALDVDEFRVFVERVRGEGGSARRVAVWIADSDPMSAKPIVTPLAKAKAVDIWAGFPFGTDAKGNLVRLALVFTNVLVGALPGTGKTFTVRLFAAAAALDPNVQLCLFDGKGGSDWLLLEKVAHRFGTGERDSVVKHVADTLDEAVADMERRYERMQDFARKGMVPQSKITPAISKNPQLEMPLVVIVLDEVQNYLDHETYGPRILAALVKLVRQARAVGITLVLATQRPDSNTIPTALRDNCGTRLAGRVATRTSGRMILGDGADDQGIDPSKLLRSQLGVSYVVGADDTNADAQFDGMLVKAHLMDDPTLARIVERARALREDAGTITGVAAGEDPMREETPQRLLDDVLAVFAPGERKLWSETICARLAEAQPAAYSGWTPKTLAAALKPLGVTTMQVHATPPPGDEGGPNRRGVALDDVVRAHAERIPDTPEDLT